MNKRLLTGLTISVAFVTAGAAVAGLGIEHGPRYAKVLDVEPVRTAERVEREVCDPVRAGAAKRAAKCRTVTETKRVLVGYDVRYRLGDEIGTVRTERPPGERLKLERGVPVSPDVAAGGASESG